MTSAVTERKIKGMNTQPAHQSSPQAQLPDAIKLSGNFAAKLRDLVPPQGAELEALTGRANALKEILIQATESTGLNEREQATFAALDQQESSAEKAVAVALWSQHYLKERFYGGGYAKGSPEKNAVSEMGEALSNYRDFLQRMAWGRNAEGNTIYNENYNHLATAIDQSIEVLRKNVPIYRQIIDSGLNTQRPPLEDGVPVLAAADEQAATTSDGEKILTGAAVLTPAPRNRFVAMVRKLLGAE